MKFQRWHCILTVLFALIHCAAGQTDTDIYSNDDLILVNPIQSSVVLLSIIAATTLIEFLFGHFSRLRNRYLRVVYKSIREELTVISFGVLMLQFVVNSFPSVSTEWRVVVEWVALCIVYLGILYCLMVSVVVFALRLRSKGWRTFEWARIDADSHHNQAEQVFKLARKYFVMELAGRLDETRNSIVSIPPVAFSSFVTLLECDNLAELLNFSIKTWMVLAVLIFVNATRSMTVASLDSGSQVTSHIVSFVVILGYLVLVPHAMIAVILQQRVRAFTVRQLDPHQYDKRANAPTSCLLFGSEKHTLEVIKVLLLATMWYTCVFIMCFVYVAYEENGPLAILIYVVAAVPPLAIIGSTPYILNLVTFCSALAVSRRDQAIAHLAAGGVVFDEVPSSDDDSDDEDLDARVKVSKRDARQSTNDNEDTRRGDGRRAYVPPGREGTAFMSAADYDETEYNGPAVMLNGADGGLLEEMRDQQEGAEGSDMDQIHVNHFGYRREDDGAGVDTAASGGRGFRDSRIYFRD